MGWSYEQSWGDEATRILRERYSLSGRAMQAIAGDLALLSEVARTSTVNAVPTRGHRAGSLHAAADSLTESVRAWRAAAAWPPHLRLGGLARDLREAGRELRASCQELQTNLGLDEVRRILGVARPVGFLHATRMESLVAKHELWIYGPSLGEVGGYARGWIREPWWSIQGKPLMDAAQAGNRALGATMNALIPRVGSVQPGEVSIGWPPSRTTPPLPSRETAIKSRRPRRDVDHSPGR